MIFRKKTSKNLLLIILLNAFAFIVTAQNQYQLKTTIRLAGDGKWDYLKMDEPKDRLFISHFDRVHVINTITNKEIKAFNHLQGVHGIALAPNLNKGFISNGLDNTVTVFNYTNLDSITTIPLKAEKADAILFEPVTKTVWVFCGKSNNVAIIDPANNTVLGYVATGAGPEFAAHNDKGIIYNNLEVDNQVVIIDAKIAKPIKTIALGPNTAPTGIAIDINNQVLFSTCADSKELVVIDLKTNAIITRLAISANVDAVAYDEKQQLVFCSGGDGITTVYKQQSKSTYILFQEIKTLPGAKTLAINKKGNLFYLSTATYKEGTKTILPNSFSVLVFGN
ncbi:MAG: YncE family protein [Sphingobacteriia bacterium]